MNTKQVAILSLLLIIVIVIVVFYNKSKLQGIEFKLSILEKKFGGENSVLTQTHIGAIINIAKVEGNGNVFGDFNTVENKISA